MIVSLGDQVADRVEDEDDEEEQEDQSIGSRVLGLRSIEQGVARHHRGTRDGEQHHRQLAAGDDTVDRQRPDHRRESDDQADVREVRSVDVAEGEKRRTADRCPDADGELNQPLRLGVERTCISTEECLTWCQE